MTTKQNENGRPIEAEKASPINRIAEPDNGDDTPNPFDPANLRLNENYAAGLGVKKVLTNISCRKPNRQEFFRVHDTHRLETLVLEDKSNREIFIIDQSLWHTLSDEASPVCFVVMRMTPSILYGKI